MTKEQGLEKARIDAERTYQKYVEAEIVEMRASAEAQRRFDLWIKAGTRLDRLERENGSSDN